MLPAAVCGQTLDECQVAAEQNYPLIKQYGLMAQTTEMTLSNIQKGWLPQISAMVQATYQSDVTAWPSQMQSMYSLGDVYKRQGPARCNLCIRRWGFKWKDFAKTSTGWALT